jgi:beta-glucanase (GH16 family)
VALLALTVGAAPANGDVMAPHGSSGTSARAARSPAIPRTALTPGAIVAGAGARRSIVCDPKYPGNLAGRHVVPTLKQRVLDRYGIADKGAVTIDHLIPLGLGGSNAITNLWPQPLKGAWDARSKNRLETQLRKLVCSGSVPLRDAQEQVAHNWIAAYRKYVDPNAQASAHDLPGWRLVFSDDFNTNVELGDFSSALKRTWFAYPPGWKDTSKNGTYDARKTVSIEDGLLNIRLHTENGVHYVAALQPKLRGTSAPWGQLYGRYAIRFRADPVPGYHLSWLLWPDSEKWPGDGEIDFPEGDLTGTISAFMHRMDATTATDQDAYSTGARPSSWHTAVIEWTAAQCTFILDGKVIGSTGSRIPSTPMHWVIQTETNLAASKPPRDDASGNVQIDWVAAWKPA